MPDLPETRHSLLVRLREVDDAPAWTEFVAIYESAIYRYARHKGLQGADAEDVTQAVLEAVYNRIDRWDADKARGSFRVWLFRVTRNLAAKAWNDWRRNPVRASGSMAEPLLAEIPEPSEEEKSIFELEYRRSLFHWAAEKVRDDVQEATWTAFRMTAVDGVTPKDAAGQLGISVASVYTAKCRVLSRIREIIQRTETG